MVQLEINQLPDYACKSSGMFKTFDGEITTIKAYPIPEMDLVSLDKSISIMDSKYQEVSQKLATQISHFLYGPELLLNNLLMAEQSPRLFFKQTVKNNWLDQTHYGRPLTIFTHDGKNINLNIANQLVYKREHLIDVTHPYFPILKKVYSDYPDQPWPWATLEMSISNVRLGDKILNQIQLYEIDLDMRYYLEIQDPTPFTAFQIMS